MLCRDEAEDALCLNGSIKRLKSGCGARGLSWTLILVSTFCPFKFSKNILLITDSQCCKKNQASDDTRVKSEAEALMNCRHIELTSLSVL